MESESGSSAVSKSNLQHQTYSPSPKTGTILVIGEQIISGNARVHNGDIYTTSTDPRPAILKWLSPLSFHQTHGNIQSQSRVSKQSEASSSGHYAGKWLLESELFITWKAREVRKLWCVGMPGAGKTVLASIIISHLLKLRDSSKAPDDGFRVAYIYLSYNEPHTIEKLLGSIIKQIIQINEPLPQALVDLWKRRNQGEEPATVQDLSDLLNELTHDRHVYIVVDAIDECPPSYRLDLVEILQWQSNNFNTLITSRLLDEFEGISKGFKTITIEADPSDVDLFISYEFSTKSRLKRFSESDPALLQEVKKTVGEACGGMFLLVSLQMQSLESELHVKGVREKLRRLPKKIEDMYQGTLNRIYAMEPQKARLAFDTLAWVLFSNRPLAMKELQHALAIEPGDLELDFDRIFHEDDIRDLCGGLVTVVNSTISFVHLTARNFLDVNSETRFPKFHSVIAQKCVAYLSLPVLGESTNEKPQVSATYDHNELVKLYRLHKPFPRPLMLSEKRSLLPFIDYAGAYLGHHLRKITYELDSGDLIKPLSTLLRTHQKRTFFLHIMWENGMPSLSGPQPVVPDGAEQEDDSSLWADFRFNNSGARSPNTNGTKIGDGNKSSGQGPGEVPASSRDITPMHLAAFLGWPPIVTEFLKTAETVAQINTIVPWDRTPLMMAVNAGHWDVVPLLLEHGALVDLTSAEGPYMLLHASQESRRDVIESLIKSLRGRPLLPLPPPPLPLPKRKRNMFSKLVDSVSFIICVPQRFSTSQASAGSSRRAGIRWSWRESGGDENEEKLHMSTRGRLKYHLRLIEAAVSDDANTIKHLAGSGKINLKSEKTLFNVAALFIAVEFGQAAAVQAILEGGVNVNVGGLKGNSPLHRAVSKNYIDVVEIILRRKPRIELKNDDRETAWSSNLDQEHREVLKVLLRAGANPNAKGRQGTTRLYQAAAVGDIEMVRFLLEFGVNPSITTKFGWSPLHWAANGGKLDCIEALIDAGAKLSPVSDQLTTPLDMARRANQTAAADLLVAAGAKTAREVLRDEGDLPNVKQGNVKNLVNKQMQELRDQAKSRKVNRPKDEVLAVLAAMTEFEKDEQGKSLASDGILTEESKKAYWEIKAIIEAGLEDTDQGEGSTSLSDPVRT
ncbi:hypothetical protein F5Y04DRAFT_286680 [Hypomontagnella monticulosa]|nr:hypothetical protein F5Y04DRAFT_286680 [Hypomontagnella monticulosa]